MASWRDPRRGVRGRRACQLAGHGGGGSVARGPGSGPQDSPVGGTRGRPSRSGPGLQSQVGGGSAMSPVEGARMVGVGWTEIYTRVHTRVPTSIYTSTYLHVCTRIYISPPPIGGPPPVRPRPPSAPRPPHRNGDAAVRTGSARGRGRGRSPPSSRRALASWRRGGGPGGRGGAGEGADGSVVVVAAAAVVLMILS